MTKQQNKIEIRIRMVTVLEYPFGRIGNIISLGTYDKYDDVSNSTYYYNLCVAIEPEKTGKCMEYVVMLSDAVVNRSEKVGVMPIDDVVLIICDLIQHNLGYPADSINYYLKYGDACRNVVNKEAKNARFARTASLILPIKSRIS